MTATWRRTACVIIDVFLFICQLRASTRQTFTGVRNVKAIPLIDVYVSGLAAAHCNIQLLLPLLLSARARVRHQSCCRRLAGDAKAFQRQNVISQAHDILAFLLAVETSFASFCKNALKKLV
jgi:hypothetical protein